MATDLWDHDNKPTLKAIHISSRYSQRATKTEKEYVFCQRYKLNVKALQVTMYIKNRAILAQFEGNCVSAMPPHF